MNKLNLKTFDDCHEISQVVAVKWRSFGDKCPKLLKMSRRKPKTWALLSFLVQVDKRNKIFLIVKIMS